MEALWSYKEIKEVRLHHDKPSELVAQHLNTMFHNGETVRDKAMVDKVKKNSHVLFK